MRIERRVYGKEPGTERPIGTYKVNSGLVVHLALRKSSERGIEQERELIKEMYMVGQLTKSENETDRVLGEKLGVRRCE